MTVALILVRCLHLSASILLASLFLFETVIVVPAARKTSAGSEQLLEATHRLTDRTALWTLLVAFVSWFAWSWLVASTMTGDDLIECFQSGDWLTVLTGTQFGLIWLFRVIISLVFGILWVVAWTSGRRNLLQTTLIGLAVIDLVSLAWAGHATATPGPFGDVHLLGDALHLLTAALWPGALVPLAGFLLSVVKIKPIRGDRAGAGGS